MLVKALRAINVRFLNRTSRFAVDHVSTRSGVLHKENACSGRSCVSYLLLYSQGDNSCNQIVANSHMAR